MAALEAQADMDDKFKQANEFKAKGNDFLAEHHYAQAAEEYTKAIDLHPTAIFYANRAQAMIKTESYGLAIADCTEALKLDPTYIKAYYRRGNANYALNKLKLALKDFKTVVKMYPKDPDAAKKFKECDKAYREEMFQKAIEFDEPSTPAIDVDAITIESSYDGPKLEIGEDKKPLVTMEFVHAIMERFKGQKLIHRKHVIQILLACIDMFKNERSLLRLSLPTDTDGKVNGSFTICGDTHGQYFDLCNIFEIGGFPSPTNRYHFNGDFVDRGSWGFETVITLMCIKLACPESLHMLRGNHETKNMNKVFGFLGEINHKYDVSIMNLFTRVFNVLPLAAVLQDKVFLVHGGLSTQEGGVTLAQIDTTVRNKEPGDGGLMSDLLWSDPQPLPGRAPSKRGLGYSFGPDYTEAFLRLNDLELVIRSHEMQEEGYNIDHGGKLITLFSAPNYCDQMGNKGAYIRFDDLEMKPKFTKFDAVPHPNVPPMRYAGGNMFSL